MNALAGDTDVLYSIYPTGDPMRPADFRYTYRPSPLRIPRWAQRLWAWF